MMRDEFVKAARSLIGARWRHRGRSMNAVDCIGTIELPARIVGLSYPQYSTRYGREPWDDQLRKYLINWCGAALPVSEAKPGDIALVRWGKSDPSHVGVIADHPDGGLSLIHAHQLHGVIEQALRGNVLSVIVEVYRPRWPDVH